MTADEVACTPAGIPTSCIIFARHRPHLPAMIYARRSWVGVAFKARSSSPYYYNAPTLISTEIFGKTTGSPPLARRLAAKRRLHALGLIAAKLGGANTFGVRQPNAMREAAFR